MKTLSKVRLMPGALVAHKDDYYLCVGRIQIEHTERPNGLPSMFFASVDKKNKGDFDDKLAARLNLSAVLEELVLEGALDPYTRSEALAYTQLASAQVVHLVHNDADELEIINTSTLEVVDPKDQLREMLGYGDFS